MSASMLLYPRERESVPADPEAMVVQSYALLAERLLLDLHSSPAATMRAVERVSKLHLQLRVAVAGVEEQDDGEDDDVEGYGFARKRNPRTVNQQGFRANPVGDLTTQLLEHGMAAYREHQAQQASRDAAFQASRERTERIEAWRVAVEAATAARIQGNAQAAERYDAQATRLADALGLTPGDAEPAPDPELDQILPLASEVEHG